MMSRVIDSEEPVIPTVWLSVAGVGVVGLVAAIASGYICPFNPGTHGTKSSQR